MPAKTVAVVTLSTAVVQFYAEQLHALFGELIQVVPYSFEDGSAYRIEPADLIIVSSSAAENYQAARQWLPPGSLSILSNITITRSALEQLMDLPRGTKALLVNLSLKMAMEVISDLHHLGVNHIEFVPFYPFAEPAPNVDLAITPDEVRHVPPHVKKIINLGQRTFDGSTITEKPQQAAISAHFSTAARKFSFTRLSPSSLPGSTRLEPLPKHQYLAPRAAARPALSFR